MAPCIQPRSDFIYPGAGQFGEFVYEIDGMAGLNCLPMVFPVVWLHERACRSLSPY